MKKIFLSFLVFACLAKPLSLGVSMAEEIGDVYPGRAPIAGYFEQIFSTLKAVEQRAVRIEEGVRKAIFLREKSIDVNIAYLFLLQLCICFFLVRIRPFLLSHSFVILHLRSPPFIS